VSWLTPLALTLGVAYVGADVLVCAVVLAIGRDVHTSVPVSRWAARVVAALVASLAALLLAATVETAVRVPALAVFPMLGALWVLADLPPMLKIGFGKGRADRLRTVSTLLTLGGLALLIGLMFAVVERQVSR
jgi:hypothetical protein